MGQYGRPSLATAGLLVDIATDPATDVVIVEHVNDIPNFSFL